MTQPDPEEPTERDIDDGSKKRKISKVDTEPNQPEESSPTANLPESKKQKPIGEAEGDSLKPTSKSNKAQDPSIHAVGQSALPRRTATAQQNRQSETPASVQSVTGQNLSAAVHQFTNHPLGGNGPIVPLAAEGFGLTAEDRRLLCAFREVNKDFWVRVSLAIRQLGGGTHSPERCKERFEVLSRL